MIMPLLYPAVSCVRDKPSYFAYRLYTAIHVSYCPYVSTIARVVYARFFLYIQHVNLENLKIQWTGCASLEMQDKVTGSLKCQPQSCIGLPTFYSPVSLLGCRLKREGNPIDNLDLTQERRYLFCDKAGLGVKYHLSKYQPCQVGESMSQLLLPLSKNKH